MGRNKGKTWQQLIDEETIVTVATEQMYYWYEKINNTILVFSPIHPATYRSGGIVGELG